MVTVAWGALGPGLATPCPLGHQEQPRVGARKRPAFEPWRRLRIGLVPHQGGSSRSDVPRASRLRPRPPEAVALLQETPGRAAPGLKAGSSGRAAEAPGAGTPSLCPPVPAHGLPRGASRGLQAYPRPLRRPPRPLGGAASSPAALPGHTLQSGARMAGSAGGSRGPPCPPVSCTPGQRGSLLDRKLGAERGVAVAITSEIRILP